MPVDHVGMRKPLIVTFSDGGSIKSVVAQHELAPQCPPQGIGKADASWTGPAVIVACNTEQAEHLLANGDLRCPRCGSGQLNPWGYGWRRTVRELAIAIASSRFLPAWSCRPSASVVTALPSG